MQHAYTTNKYRDIRPVDFDTYLNSRLSNTSYSNLEITEEKTISNIRLNNLYFTADDGARIYSKYLLPLDQEVKGIILMFHGYHVDSGSWYDKIGYAAMGYAVFAIDCRGQSGKSEDNSTTIGSTLKGLVIKGIKEGRDNLHMLRQYLDTYRIGIIASTLHPDLEIQTLGESQGGALSLVASALLPNVKTCITQYPYLCDFRLAYEMGYGYSGINDYFMWEDPQGVTYDSFFSTLSYIDVVNFAPRITADVHLLVGGKDVVCPPICQFSMYNNLVTTKKYYIYPEKGHEHLHNSEDLKMNLITK